MLKLKALALKVIYKLNPNELILILNDEST